jgi:hypothetical protein
LFVQYTALLGRRLGWGVSNALFCDISVSVELPNRPRRHHRKPMQQALVHAWSRFCQRGKAAEQA